MLTATPELFSTIRALLGDPKPALTDELLGGAILGEAAEARVLEQIGEPVYADRTATEQATIATAVAYMTAANWLRTQRRTLSLTGERFSGQFQWSGKGVDVDAWIADLEGMARATMEPLITETAPTTPRMSLFRTAAGRRGASTC